MILRTKRLVLRPLREDDALALFAILGDAQAMAFWDRPALPRLSTVEALLADELAAMARGDFRYWTVLDGGDVIGGIDLSHIAGDTAELGFLFRRDVWGHGYAREAAAAVIGDCGLARLTARIHQGNDRAARVLDALGFRPDEVLKDYALADGWRRDCVRYVLTRSASQKGA